MFRKKVFVFGFCFVGFSERWSMEPETKYPSPAAGKFHYSFSSIKLLLVPIFRFYSFCSCSFRFFIFILFYFIILFFLYLVLFILFMFRFILFFKPCFHFGCVKGSCFKDMLLIGNDWFKYLILFFSSRMWWNSFLTNEVQNV